MRQLANALTMTTFKIKNIVEPSEFEGPYAISDELLAKFSRISSTEIRKQQRDRENSFRIANERPISAKQSLESITSSRPNSRHLMLSPTTKELLRSRSKDMLQLTKSNVIPSETPEQRLQRIHRVIRDSRIVFAQNMDDIITERALLMQQKEQRRLAIARKIAGKWKWRQSLSGTPKGKNSRFLKL